MSLRMSEFHMNLVDQVMFLSVLTVFVTELKHLFFCRLFRITSGHHFEDKISAGIFYAF